MPLRLQTRMAVAAYFRLSREIILLIGRARARADQSDRRPR